MHIPMANRIPPMVPKIRDTRFFFSKINDPYLIATTIISEVGEIEQFNDAK
jgi:hypothetical protein